MRNLTLYGKILIVNTLTASLFVHRLTVMRTVPTIWYKKFQDLANAFIWNGRKPKIAWKIVTGNKENGGLGLVDLKKKHDALKVAWVTRLHKKEKIANLAYELLKNQYGHHVWLCNLKPKELSELFSLDNFWGDVLQDWLQISKIRKNQTEVDESVWLNMDIKIANQVLYHKKLINKGVCMVSHFFIKKKIMTWQEFNDKYPNLLTYLQYQGLVVAIPKKHKTQLEHRKPHMYVLLEKIDKPTKIWYQTINENKNLLESKNVMWKVKLQLAQNIDVCKAIQNISYFTLCTKLRSFQYKLLTNAILTKVRLKKMGVIQDDTCKFCNKEKETTEHLFVNCTEVKKSWEYVKKNCNYRIELSPEKIIFNNPVENPRHIYCTAVLITKYYIYCTRVEEKQLTTTRLKQKIVQQKEIDYEIAKGKNKIDHHNRKWGNFKL